MTTALPSTTREILLADNPTGLPGPEHFTIARRPVPVRGSGQVVVRNRYFLVFPGLRTLIGGQADGVPLPRIHVGDTLFGPAVGEVVAASPDSPLQSGDAVTHRLGWREHALVAAADCTPLGDVLPDPVAHLSSGSAAYGALSRLAQVRPGDTVFVTGAAGAVGTTPRALRFYEERGLLSPPRRTTTGQREYGPDEVARVRVIRELLALGLTVEDLRGVSDRIGLLVENPQRRCGSPDSGVPGSGVVDRRLAALDAEIDRLTRLRTGLAQRTYGQP